MSQPRTQNIADFFLSHAKTIPKKRSISEPDDDTIVIDTTSQPSKSTPQTPATSRVRYGLAKRELSAHDASPSRHLTTPRSGRSVPIPIRSPAVESPSRPLSVKRPALFRLPSRSSQTSPASANPPSFSFADLPSSDRRVIEDGKLVAVRDSDEEDNESLESLTDLLDRKKSNGPPQSSGVSNAANNREEERVQMLSMYTGGRSNPIINKESIRTLQRRQQTTKFDIEFLMDEQLADQEAEEKIRKANAEIQMSTEEMEQDRRKERDKNLLTAILQGNLSQDPEDMTRILNAVDRTEAFTTEKTFSFFGRVGLRDAPGKHHKKKVFPRAAIPHRLWEHKDTEARDRAYLSGFMAEQAQAGQLDDTALRWTFEAVLQEDSDELRESYINCIAASSSSWTRANVTPEHIHNTFVELGADNTAIRDGTEIQPQYQLKREFQRTNNKHLLAALRLFQLICQDMDFATLSKFTSIISRLSLDHEAMSNNKICQAVETILDKLINLPNSDSRQHIQERLFTDLGANLTDPVLQAQFISHVTPISPTATALHTKLALVFLLGSRAAQNISSTTTEPLLVTLTNHLSLSPSFSTTWHASSSTGPDYVALTALVSILDAAISDGHPPASLSGSSTSSSVDARTLLLNRKSDEAMFNSHVDDLAETIHSLFTSIADSGASHMRRTEAKDALQALHYRLLYGVRTKAQRKKHVFDPQDSTAGSNKKGRFRDMDEVLQEAKGKDFMARFLKKTEDPIDIVGDGGNIKHAEHNGIPSITQPEGEIDIFAFPRG